MRHGETADLMTLYKTYSGLLSRTTPTYVSHSKGVQDVVHDVFAIYLVKRPTFQGIPHQRAWMLRTTIDKCRDLQRRNAVHGYTPLEDAGHIVSLEDSETSELLTAVRNLPDKLREVVVLHYPGGFLVEEAACCSRISIPAVKMRLTHGRQAIKALLGTEK